jgi:hypothetical protein
MASPTAVLSVLVKADTAKAVAGLSTLQKRLESASKSADELTDKLFFLGQMRIKPKIDLDDGGADVKVDALQAKLDRLGAGEVTAKVEVATAQAHAELDRLANSDFTIHGSVDLDTGAAEAKLIALRRQAAGIGGGFGGGIGSGSGSSGGGFFGAPGSFIASNPLISLGIAGAPLLPTVGASLAQGALGAGALGTAAAGAGAVGGAGIASVAVGGIADITKALTAYTAQQQAAGANAVQSAQQQLQAASAQHAAAQQVQTAEESLTTAQQQETFAQQALTLARKDAVRQLTDMRRAATESTTAEQQARLNLEVARRALAQAPAGTSQLELRQLQLSAKEAQQAFRDAGIAKDRAQQDSNKAQQQGVSQMPQVVAAQRSLQTAQQGVADASRNVKQAEYAQAQASKQAALQAKALAISQGQVGLAMKQLPAAGREAVQMLNDLRDTWETLSKPASTQFFGLVQDGIQELNKLLPMFARSAESSVGAVRDAFDKFFRSLNSPGFQKFVHIMTVTFAKGIGPLLKGFENLAVILERIAIAAAPGLLKMLKGFREMTGDWRKSTSNAKDLHGAVSGVIRQFKDWLGLIGAVGQVLGALFIANTRGARAGGNAVKQLTRTLQGWADWINTHRHKVNVFFINLLHTVEILAGALGNLAMTIAPLSSAFIPISKAIVTITNALNHLKVGNVSALTVLLGALGARSLLGKLGVGGAAAGASEGGLLAGLAGGSAVGGLAVGGLGAAGAVGAVGAFTSKGGIPDTLKGNAVDTSIWSELLQKSIQQVIDKFGSFAKGVKHMSASQKQAFLGLIQDAHNAGQITDAVFNKLMTTVAGTTTQTTKSIKDWASTTVDRFQRVMDQNDKLTQANKDNSDKVTKSTSDMATRVGKSYQNMAVVSGKGMDTLKKNTNNALKGLGVGKTIDFSTFTLQGTPGAHQRGGHIGGTGTGDTVPAMLEPGEFVLNREAVKGIGQARLEAMNKALPRFQKGGSVNAMTAMVREANKFEQHHFPYAWGGGHSGFGIQPVDCSGAVSDVLHAAGLLNAPLTSGGLESWGKPGRGPLTVWAGPAHVVMGLNGRVFGTSGFNPGGGAGWIDEVHGDGASLVQAAGGLAATRTMDVKGGVMGAIVKKIARQIIKGPRGALGGSAQMSLDHVWQGANAYLAKHTPSGKFGGGQAAAGTFPALPGGWHRVGATYEGLDGAMGAYGTVGGMGFAELLLAGANTGIHPNLEDVLGTRIPPLGKVQFRMPGSRKAALAVKNDIGSGQPSPHYLVDIQTGLRNAIGWSPNQDVEVKKAMRGGLVRSFGGGGVVPGPIGRATPIIAHGGERVKRRDEKTRYAITITNWKQGTGYMEEIADGAVNGQRRLSNQLSRMSR